jgi:hypothetical protein
MARQKKAGGEGNGTAANLGFEAKLWLAADKLRNNQAAQQHERRGVHLCKPSLVNHSSKASPFGAGNWAIRSGTGRIVHPANRQRNRIGLVRWYWSGACARPSGG